VKTGEGALQEVQDMLNRMVTLATQSANGTYDETTDRVNLQKEVTALKDEIDRIADSSNFNGIQLLDGTQSAGTATVSDWGTGTGKATISLQITGTGADLIGGKIVVGKQTFNVVAATTTTAATLDGTTIKVTKTATGSDIAGVLNNKINAVDAKDTAGNKLSMTASVSGDTIKFEATTAAKAIDATSLPEMKANAGLNLQIGDTSMTYNQMNVGISDMHASALFISDIDISTQEGATSAINKIKNAINMVSSTRGDLGAIQNRLEHTENNLSVMTENIQDAESTIRDTDVAEEMMAYTKNNILVQSAQAMLAQANSVPQGVLQLLQ
jgi:flagellin